MKWQSIFLYFLLLLFVFLFILYKKYEGFGATSPGTLVQLQTSHVPTEEDEYYYKYVYPRLVEKEIRNMTESDF